MVITILFSMYLMYQCDYNLQYKIANIASKAVAENLSFSFQVLSGGLSSPGVYKFKIDNKEYVLRLGHPNMSTFDKNRTIMCHKLAANNNISPDIQHYNIDQGVIISKYISGGPVQKQNLINNNLLVALAQTIKKLHNIKEFPSRSKNIFAIRKSFEKKAMLLNSDLILESSRHLEGIDKLIKKNKPNLVSTHYDLKPENILFDNKFMIIDWEAACLGYAYFDLATILVFYNLSDDEQDKFLQAYYNRKLTTNEKEQINFFKQEVLGYYGMAYLMLSVSQELKPLSLQEINDLPDLYDYLETKFAKNKVLDSYVEAQKLGWILLKKLDSFCM